MSENEAENTFNGIAIIGMSGRFPGAMNIARFWQNLREGKESIKFFSDEELKTSEPDFETLKNDPNYVRARGVLENIDCFDAGFFGYSPNEAAILDPQQRLWLECAWEALENAGYDPERYKGLIGVFGGGSFLDSYLLHNLCRNREHIEMLVRMRSSEAFSSILNNSMGFMPTRTSYKLNLRGPSVNVQTACSTSLVAVCLACQSLSNYDSDMCLAGGVSILVPQEIGYFYEEGGIPSPDGHCRPFDAAAKGTVMGNGLGIVVLKRVQDALEDHDNILAVIRGWGVNNDGSQKLSYSAPSVDGQAEAIAMAQAMAGIDPETITYIEAHGTATALGDPVEVAALTRAFRAKTKALQFCGIGSVKGNVGHLDAAAGVTGLIKAVLALQHREIPPSLHYKSPNPEIDFAHSPFYVVDKLREWQTNGKPRRAGVSSFGIGGTNAHVVLEEAPKTEPSGGSRSRQLILLSGKTKSALDGATVGLCGHLRQYPDANVADVAYTLQVGRRVHNYRRYVVCKSAKEAEQALESGNLKRVKAGHVESIDPEVVFMFSGQGSEHVNMGFELYRTEKVFQREVDRCSEILKKHLGIDLREILYPDDKSVERAKQELNRQSIIQPALFVIEKALSALWMAWGVKPKSMVGHSVGEITAACLAGVFSLEDALSLVAARGKVMEDLPPGGMLTVFLSEKEIQPYLSEDLCLGLVNAPNLCVLSGQESSIANVENQLVAESVGFKRLRSTHAFHSKMTESVLGAFANEIAKVKLSPPKIPFLSNVTGTWVAPDEAADPDYWIKQLRQTVRFSHCISELLKEPNRVLLEVGPGQMLCTLAGLHLDAAEIKGIFPSTRHPNEEISDVEFILNTIGSIWLSGVQFDWDGFNKSEKRHRVPLPTYPFERRRYWMDSVLHSWKLSPSTGPQAEKIDEIAVPGEKESENSGAERAAIVVGGNIEETLIAIWKDLLGHDQITTRDNFFDLGGNSLIALSFFARIEKETGKKMPLATLYRAPTISQLAGIFGAIGSEEPWSSSVEMQPGDSRLPLFLVHGAGGNVLLYRDLVRHLGPDQPAYGLQSRGLDGQQEILTTIRQMASHYLKEVRTIQPRGPYLLGGYCMGGSVALEMAQQLHRSGEHVALLFLLETYNFSKIGEQSLFDRAHYNLQRLKYHWLNYALLGQNGKSDFMKEKINIAISRKAVWLGTLESMLGRRGFPNSNQARNLADIWRANDNAAMTYSPQTYGGKIIQFKAFKEYAVHSRPEVGWESLARGGLEIHRLPVYPAGMLVEPYVRELAARLKKYIAEATN